MPLFFFIWSFVRKYQWTVGSIFLLSLMWTFETLFWPFFLGRLVDVFTQYDLNRVAAGDDLKTLLLMGGGGLIFMEAGFRTRDFLVARLIPKLEADMRLTMFDHVQRHSPQYFSQHFSGSLANKIGDMVLKTPILIRNVLIYFIPAAMTCILTLVIFADMNSTLALILGSWIAVHFVLSWVFTLKCADYSLKHGEVRSTLVGKIVDSLTNNFIVNLFYRFRFEKDHISRYQQDEKKANFVAQIYSVKMFTLLSATFVVEMFILIGGMLHFWTAGKISTGEIVQLFNTIWNLGLIIWSVASIAPEFFLSLGIAKQALTIMEDPQDILDIEGAADLQVNQGEIIFDNVTFNHGGNPIFQNKSLRIKAGEKVGLVGYSGAGKSTFLNLILRFFSLEKGRILIDGQDIAHVTLQSLRKQISLIPQDPTLFHRNLEENIRYGNLEASAEEVVRAAKLAHCHEFIQKFSEGYLTLVGERGSKLSGGEKQRIAIARAMLLKAPILLLDEATSALDSVTEQYIQETLTQLMAHRTCIVIAHRLSTLAQMDRILVLDKGKVIEEGSHQELLAKKGHYAHLWHMQAGGFLPDRPLSEELIAHGSSLEY